MIKKELLLTQELLELAGTTNAYGCVETHDGGIIGSWDGTTDSVVKYSSDLSTELWTYSDASYLSAPRGVAVRANGNILILDYTFSHIVELSPSGEYIRRIGAGAMYRPQYIHVIP